MVTLYNTLIRFRIDHVIENPEVALVERCRDAITRRINDLFIQCELIGSKYFKFAGKTSNLLKIVAGAVAGSGLCYGLISTGAVPTPKKEKYYLGNSEDANDSLAANWVSPDITDRQFGAVLKSRELIRRFKNETGAPGVVVGVSIDGKIVWKEGVGYSNLENGSLCHGETAMRIASISKPITMALLAKMWEDGKVDLDKPINSYVEAFPVKKVDGEDVAITTRQLASHTSGIRHYTKKGETRGNDSNLAEFYIKEKYNNVENSLNLFKDDELLFKPGSNFEYTTHGYTLLSAVIEKVGNKPFKELIQDFFKVFKMQSTYLDDVNTIIYNRSSYYSKNNKGKLINAELADTSYKWAGGGIVSTVGDLLKFGNAMMYCYQQKGSDKSGYLKSETIRELWTPVEHSVMSWEKGAGYGLGWVVVPHREDLGGIDTQDFYVGHGGGAVGASSVLVIIPNEKNEGKIPSGTAIAILTNLQDTSCHKLAKKIAEQFS